MAKPSKQRLIFGIFLIAFIVLIELFMHHFHLPAWPAFMVMIFFFETHTNLQRAPHILVGGLVGIFSLVLVGMFLKTFAPIIGFSVARLLFICIFVYLIVALGEVVPMVFNNYAFMFFLVSAVAARIQEPAPNPWLWMGIELIGGLVVVGGIMGIVKLMGILFAPQSGAAPAGQES